MKFHLNWFQKAEPVEPSRIDDQQGGYTDHSMSAYGLRQAIAPLHGEELEAFEYILDLMAKQYPNASQSDLIEHAFDRGHFVNGARGELRVSQESPE